jgi:flagellar assembly protein FliH
MAEMRKFMFDVDFSPQLPQRVEKPVVEETVDEPEDDFAPSATFSEEELTLARDSAFEEGRQQGRSEGAADVTRRVAAALEGIAGQLAELARIQAEANDEAARNAVRVALAALAKMLPAYCEKNACDEVARVVEEVIAHVLDEPRVIVRVAVDIVEEVRPHLEAAAENRGFEGRVVVQGDGRLQSGDCRVEWGDGGAERDQARLMKEIEATVARALAPPERPVA